MSGTPKSLLEAIINGMLCGPMSEVPQNIDKHVMDFINQKFAWAEFAYADDPSALEAIRSLAAKLSVRVCVPEKVEAS